MLYFYSMVLLSSVFLCASLTSATLEVELQRYPSNKELEKARTALLQARAEYQTCYYSHMDLLERNRSLFLRMNIMKESSSEVAPPRKCDREALYQELSAQRSSLLRSHPSAFAAIIQRKDKHTKALDSFVALYATCFQLTARKEANLKQSVDGRVGFRQLTHASLIEQTDTGA